MTESNHMIIHPSGDSRSMRDHQELDQQEKDFYVILHKKNCMKIRFLIDHKKNESNQMIIQKKKLWKCAKKIVKQLDSY